jgi:tetratricopeptide (TPR) repeat protein
MSTLRLRAAAPFLVVALASVSCGRAKQGTAPVFPKAPVVLISVDTLRSDHLPFYGYQGVETPALSALRADSVLFEKAYSHAPLTLPAHVSVFTGLLPAGHGVRDNLGYRLKPEVPILTELLKKEGYRTGGAVSAFVLLGATGMGRGFDFYEDGVQANKPHMASSMIQRSGAETEGLLEGWIAGGQGEPLFAFLHLYEPHTPYEPKEPFRSRYASSLYDGEIAAADEIVGKFIGFLKEKGIYDRALVVFLSDHGESLGEHGEEEHGVFLYRAALQVPLLVKLPKGQYAGSTVKAAVQLSDVFTTIGQAVALKGLPPIAGTVNLLSLAAGAPAPERRVYAETVFPRTHFGWSDLASVLDGKWQYVDAPHPEFYDLATDPGELTNLVEKRPGPFRSMKLELEKARAAFEAPGAVSDEEKKKLASLGYLSTGATPASGPLPDPKDEIGVIATLRAAFSKAKHGEPQEAIVYFEKLLEKNPRMLDVWDLYSEVLLDVGRPDDALAARKKTVELAPPGATVPLISVADLCLQIGKPDEALKNAQLARERGDTGASELIARAWLAKGDDRSAEVEARAGLKDPRLRKRSLLLIARIEAKRQNYLKALEALDAILADGRADDVPIGTHHLRGDIYARLDRAEDAERELREEIRRNPGQIDARSGLALVYASLDRMGDAKGVLAEMVAQVGTADAYFRGLRALSFFQDRPGAEALRREGLRRFPSDPRFRKPV